MELKVFDPNAEYKPSSTISITGVVTKLFHTSPKFSAGRIHLNGSRKEVSFAGKVYVGAIGGLITLNGQWTDHEKYGKQFKAESVAYEESIDPDGLANWLAHHPDASGIGAAKARQLAREFGADFCNVLLNDPEQVANFARVPLVKVIKLAKSWQKHQEYNRVATRLSAWNLSEAQIAALYEKFKGAAVHLVETNPYLVIREVSGFGFRKADDIAQKVGFTKDNPARLSAGILNTMQEALDDGHTCRTENEILDAAEYLLALDVLESRSVIKSQLECILNEDSPSLIKIQDKETPLCAKPYIYQMESFVASYFKCAKDENTKSRAFESEQETKSFVMRACAELDDSQQGAIRTCLQNKISLISGGAGTGKTTTIKTLVRLFRDFNSHVVLCAPTGKAARRLTEVTGLEAMTIHRTLGYRGKSGFKVNSQKPLKTDVVIVDEVSMVDVELAYHLLSALTPDTCLIMVGDHHQLPAIGPGAILRDCIEHKLIPMTILQQCHRQASRLKLNSSLILQGIVAQSEPEPGENLPSPWYVHRMLRSTEDYLECIERLFTNIIPCQWGYDVIFETQFLAPIHKGPLGTRAINTLLQRLHQESLDVTVEPRNPEGPPKYYIGDKVIQTKNNYDIDVMNGTLGTITSMSPLVVCFEDREVSIPQGCAGEIDLAYCLTPHKCQGSEWPCIVTIVNKLHTFMHHRNWLYTAVTRAQKTSAILSDDWTVRSAAEKLKNNKRRTLLPLLMSHIGEDVVQA